MDTPTLSQEQKDKLFEVSFNGVTIQTSVTVTESGKRFSNNLVKTLEEQLVTAKADLEKYTEILPLVTALAEAYTPPTEQVTE